MARENVQREHTYSLNVNIQQEIASYGIEQKMNDYIGLQKIILPVLEKEGLFREVINEESGMSIEITKKGIKETLGSGTRFQNLPRKLKELKIATLRSIPNLLSVAHLVRDNVPNSHGNASRYAYFIVCVEMKGVLFNVRMSVQKSSAKNKFWLHIIDIKEKNPQLLSPSLN